MNLKNRFTLAAYLITILMLPPCSCLEEAVPAISLPPRHFNYHPYEIRYSPTVMTAPNENTGPVLFPETRQEQEHQGGRGWNHLDVHPYASVAKRQRYKQAGRFHNQDNHVNPQVYKALATYASKVLTRPTAALKEYADNPSLSNAKKNYAFSYKVVDRTSGDDFSHSQSQNSEATSGEYRVKLPDGRVQIVSYTADKNGYKADVKYAENDNPINYEPQHTGRHSKNQLNSVPIDKSTRYDYSYVDFGRSNLNQGLPIYETAVQPTHATKINNNFDGHTTATPRPFVEIKANYYQPYQIVTERPRLIYAQNLIAPESGALTYSDIRRQEGEKIVVTTSRPPFSGGSSEAFQEHIISTAAPRLERFRDEHYVQKPKLRILANTHTYYK